MAKSQKHSNREMKKPKAKPVAALATSNLASKGTMAPLNSFKKKK